ncbi:MAG: hypothetical protein VX003_05085, partial [SAR324 cluster bacterium]|nr:hypothetical protein [SAR324 cluster bacterium]
GHFHQFRLADFEIEYQDPAGNIGEKETWTSDDSFVDVDTSDPVVSLVSYASSNADNSTAMPGDNLTLVFSVSEPIQSLKVSDVTIAGLNILSTSPLNSDNTSWKVIGIAVKELMDNLGQGGGGGSNNAAYQFRVKDRSGNTSEEVNGGGITLDSTPPVNLSVNLSSDNSKTLFEENQLARDGDNITLAFSFDEPVQFPEVELAGFPVSDHLIQDTSDGNGTDWEAIYRVLEEDPERDVTFQVSFKDLAGNEGLSFSTGNTKTVKIDTQPPNLTKVSLSSIGNVDPSLARAHQKVQLEFEGSEKLRDPTVVIHGQTIPLIGVEQTWSARYSVVKNDDLALNPRELEGLKLWLDASNIDGQNNTSLSNGALVGEWQDLSGHAHHVTQTTDNRKPSLVTNLDKPYLSFDGSNDSLEADFTGHILDNPSGKDLTIFTVVRPKEGYYILSTGGQATAATGYALSFQAGNSFSTMKDNSGGRELYISDLFAPNNTHLVTHSYSETYTNIDVLVNGSSSGSEFTHYNSSINSHQKITIGKPNNLNSYYGKFEIAEVIVISSTDAQKIMGIQYYLSKKWGLTTNVDSDGDGVSDVSDATPAGLVTQPKQVEFEITYEDEAGNEGIVVDNTTNRSFVRIDTTNPELLDVS